MGEYEPDDSRDVTQSTHTAPGEPPRTGPREGEARREAQRSGEDREMLKNAGRNDTHGLEGQREQDIETAAVERGDPLGQG